MYQVVNKGVVTEEELEIKLMPVGHLIICQISSGLLRGTISIQKDIEKDELSELTDVLYNLIQELTLNPIDSPDEVGN
jgi:hypothetical protein